jgi:hypothetical protein
MTLQLYLLYFQLFINVLAISIAWQLYKHTKKMEELLNGRV